MNDTKETLRNKNEKRYDSIEGKINDLAIGVIVTVPVLMTGAAGGLFRSYQENNRLNQLSQKGVKGEEKYVSIDHVDDRGILRSTSEKQFFTIQELKQQNHFEIDPMSLFLGSAISGSIMIHAMMSNSQTLSKKIDQFVDMGTAMVFNATENVKSWFSNNFGKPMPEKHTEISEKPKSSYHRMPDYPIKGHVR